MGRIGLCFFTRKDGWIHALPSLGAKWTQTRDLRGLPKQTFHQWWAERTKGENEKARSIPATESRPHPRGYTLRRG